MPVPMPFSAAASVPEDPLASAHLARAAIVHDAIMLAAASNEISRGMTLALTRRVQHAVGAVALGDGRNIVPSLLEECRKGWPKRDGITPGVHRIEGDMLEYKLAFAGGWMLGRGVEDILFENGNARESGRADAYDGATIRLLLESEDARISEALSPSDVAELFRLLTARTMVGMHTLDPDLRDIDGWIDRYLEWNDTAGDRYKRLATAFLNSDSRETSRFLDDPAFHDHGDPILALSARVSSGAPVPSVRLANVIGDPGRSRYALAMAEGVKRLLMADQVFQGKQSATQLRSELS